MSRCLRFPPPLGKSNLGARTATTAPEAGPAARQSAAVDRQQSANYRKPEKSVLLAAGGKIWAEGKFGGFFLLSASK